MAVEVERIDMSRFSHWLRLKRVVAWMIRFTSNCCQAEEDRESECLTVDELSDAEHLIVNDIQTTSFTHKVKLVSSCQPLPLSNKLSVSGQGGYSLELEAN